MTQFPAAVEEYDRPGVPALHRLRPEEIEHLPGARSRIASVGETGDHPGAQATEIIASRIKWPNF